jgi:enoyl-[acyl-carrier protein] reductase II
MKNRITELLGVKYPIVQAPMGWIARAQLASAVSTRAGSGSSRPPPAASTRCARR